MELVLYYKTLDDIICDLHRNPERIMKSLYTKKQNITLLKELLLTIKEELKTRDYKDIKPQLIELINNVGEDYLKRDYVICDYAWEFPLQER